MPERATRLSMLLLVALTACTPTASSPSASPTAVTSVTPVPPTATATTTSAPTASATPIALPTTAQLAAASGGVVWAYVNGDHLFVSLNRGDTWTQRTLPPSTASGYLAFVSAGEGWWLAPSIPGTQCSFQAVTIWKTDDGAATWRKLEPSGLADARCKTGIAFSDSSSGFIPVQDPNSRPAIYRTLDGGSWSLSGALADPPGFTTAGGSSLQVGNIANFGSVLFADALGSAGGTLKHFLYRSTDRGATWTYASTALQSTPIVFLTPTRWLQIFTPGDSRVTSDAGQTWAFFATDYQQAAPVAPQIVFGDADTGYATVRGSIQRTTDGGLHWSSIKTPGT